MKKLFKMLLKIAITLLLLAVLAVVYLNLVYLPQKVKKEGPMVLEQKSKGRLQAEAIEYVPFKGLKLNRMSLLSAAKEPIFTLEKVYLQVNPWILLIRRQLDFQLDLYPAKAKRPLVFEGLYQPRQKSCTVNFKIKTDLFALPQDILGKISVFLAEQRLNIDTTITSANLNLQARGFIKDEDLRIEKFLATFAQSNLELIGDVQDLSRPTLNIYGDLALNLADLKKLNPEYLKLPKEFSLEGLCNGKVFLSGQPDNPQMGLKMNAAQVKVNQTELTDLSFTAKIENKRLYLTRLYARLCEGEVTLEGNCDLAKKDLPGVINVNLFNLNLHQVIKQATDKDWPVHGRLFALACLEAALKNPKAVQGKAWASSAGSNILRLPIFTGIAEVLHLPQLSSLEFKEASGNFAIGEQQINTSDFRVVGNNAVFHFKGYVDFAGNLAFDVQPSFSESFLAAPNIGNILGIFTDSTTGNFLGEIKLKGTLKDPRYTFKPLSAEKFFPQAVEKVLKELFKLKKEEE